MDQEMEADELFPDKLVSESALDSANGNTSLGPGLPKPLNDTMDDVGHKSGEGGDCVVNGDEGGRTEEMETDDEPVARAEDEGIEMGEIGDLEEEAIDLERCNKEVDEEDKTPSEDAVDTDNSSEGDDVSYVNGSISTRKDGNNDNAEHGVIEDLQDVSDQNEAVIDTDNSNIDGDADETPAGTTLKNKTDIDIVEETDNVENEDDVHGENLNESKEKLNFVSQSENEDVSPNNEDDILDLEETSGENNESDIVNQIPENVECAQEVGADVGNMDDEITKETVDNEAEFEEVENVPEIEEQANTDDVGVDNTEKEATEDEDIDEEELLGIGEEDEEQESAWKETIHESEAIQADENSLSDQGIVKSHSDSIQEEIVEDDVNGGDIDHLDESGDMAQAEVEDEEGGNKKLEEDTGSVENLDDSRDAPEVVEVEGDDNEELDDDKLIDKVAELRENSSEIEETKSCVEDIKGETQETSPEADSGETGGNECEHFEKEQEEREEAKDAGCVNVAAVEEHKNGLEITEYKEEPMDIESIELEGSEANAEKLNEAVVEKADDVVTDELEDINMIDDDSEDKRDTGMSEQTTEDATDKTIRDEDASSDVSTEHPASVKELSEEATVGESSTATPAHSKSAPASGTASTEESVAVNQSEVTPSGGSLSQSKDTLEVPSVRIKKEHTESTEESKSSEDDTSVGKLKIVGVTSAVGVDDKGDNADPKILASKQNAVTDKVKIKQEALAAATATEKADVKKLLNDELKKKIKQDAKAKADEDDDVIAIKEERKPVQKPKPSKIQTCIVCGNVGKCKYNIVRNGDVKHLCDDTCFKRFRSSPTTYLKQAETGTPSQPKPEAQTNSKVTPTTAIKIAAPVKAVPNQQTAFQPQQAQVYKTCTVCQLMNVRTSKPFLNWQGLDYCGEECLGKYQSGLSNNCSYCSGAIFPNNKAKFCCRVGNEVKHFCSTNCNNDFVKRMKLCAFCNKDLSTVGDSFMAPVGETFKDFCSQKCLQKFEDKNNKDVEIVGVQKGQKAAKVSKGNFVCAVCGKVGPVKHEFKLDSKINRLCSDPCFSAFQYANKLTLNTCDNCGTNLNAENQAPQYVQFEGQQRRFCSFMCVNTFRNTNKKTVPCAWCGNKKSNFDMIERVDAGNKYQLFCSLNCLSLYRVNLQATSNQAVTCDQCRKCVPAQYHLTMSDASVRNFCSYGCVMQFQAQFQAPAKQVSQQNNTVSIGRGQTTTAPQPQPQQPQQTTTRSGRVVTKGRDDGAFVTEQTVTRSGRVVTKAPKVAAAVQQQIGRGRGAKKDADSFPIISNVVSLAPQGTQQQINIKSSTPVTVTSQQQGIKATTTTIGNQTVQQQIIIQPPPPKSAKNKSLLCKPFTQTKATSCRPHTQNKEVQTDGKMEPDKLLIPVPVPLYTPTPLAMYSLPTPILIPIPIPIPVPVFIPTTKKSAISILKQIKEIREKIPADPLEAELLMMAEAVAGKDEESSSSSEEEDTTVPPPKETASATTGASGDLGEDMLQMALRMASEMTDEPVMDLENSLEPVAVNTEPPPQPKPVVQIPQPVEEDDEYVPISSRSRRSRGGGKRSSRSTPRRNPKRQKIDIQPEFHEATPSPPAPTAPPPDANFHLKYTYGVNAFKHWVIQKNSQIEQTSKPGHGKNLKTFKTDILQCTADELNYSLCLFVKEVRKPNGEEYAVDSIYYLCLGIQQYLFENGRIDNIFTDFYYERFTEGLNEILTRYEPKLNHAGQLVCRIEEEHLWESKQLGAHSPHVLLNSLVYFNTKYFMLKTSEDHLKLSFTHIMKHWKKTPSGRGSGTGPNAGRSVYLRYYCPTQQGKDNQKKKKEEMPVYEQSENLDNPLRCPVKLYEFYLSKCPESIKNRNDTFYLKAERSSVPDSPVWYSNQTIAVDHLTKLLNRIRLVREIQEAHLHTQPIYI